MALSALVACLVPALGCSGGPGALGEHCAAHGDCADDAQCLLGLCAPRCRSPIDCGGGYLCSPDGLCEVVSSAIGDPCDRELACGPGQSCQLQDGDRDGDGRLDATCGLELAGTVTGAACAADGDCRTGLCSLGRCSELCGADADCPLQLGCVDLPRPGASSGARFRGCMQPSGTLELSVPVGAPFSEIAIPVPGNARSFAMIARIADASQFVGAATVRDPDGEVLYATPHSHAELYANPIRYEPARAISTLFVPNTPRVALKVGVYRVEVASFLAAGGLGTAVPEVTVRYQLGVPGSILDLNFYFLNLVDHPCSDAFDPVDGLNAAGAAASPLFQNDYLGGLRAVFAPAGIALGEITYRDIQSRPDLDSVPIEGIGRLLELSDAPSGINVFFVRSLTPLGVQTMAGGTPGPPGVPGTAASGVVVSVDTLCYRDWQTLARSTAHAMGRELGLFRNREPDGAEDPIDDSDLSSDNLMYFGELGGIELSPGQVDVIRRNPVLR